MFGIILKNQSILKKFLLINLIIFIFIGGGTIIYLKTVQPNLIKTKAVNHIKIINNTINHIKSNVENYNKYHLFNIITNVIFPYINVTKCVREDNDTGRKFKKLESTFLNFFLILFT